jgi:single-strand DNA-binding protein
MNLVLLTGRLVRDPEISTKGEHTICRFTMAVRKNKDEADFIDCVAFGKTAENISKYSAKGDNLAIQAKISTKTFQNQEGKTQKAQNITCDFVEFLTSKGDKKSSNADSKKGKTVEDYESEYAMPPVEDDLPF